MFQINQNFLKELASFGNISIDKLKKFGEGDNFEIFSQKLQETEQINESKYLRFLAQYLNIKYVPTLNNIDPVILKQFTKLIPYHKALDFLLVPYEKIDNKLYIAVTNPTNDNMYQWLSEHYDSELVLTITPKENITNILNNIYEREESAEDALDVLGQEKEFSEIKDTDLDVTVELLDERDEEPIIRLVNSIMFQAVRRSSSDIHINPGSNESVVRFRIHGDLKEITKFPKYGHNPVVNRIKVMASMDISTKNKTQDGRISIMIGGSKIDIRASILPTMYGERVVLRILDNNISVLKLSSLGLNEKMEQTIIKLVKQPHGIVLVTGPTGCGKTTTLYACLEQIDSKERNIITIEDPVEYQLQGLGQVQVNEKIGLTFSTGLRSILRQDPDVIMVGEIRDGETAEIAIQASLTGHLVFSTLHTNDAASTITRLVDMGIEPFLIATTLSAAIAKRLVRIICTNCKESYAITKNELKSLNFPKKILKNFEGKLWKGKGCVNCFHTGYSGRDGVYEILSNSAEIKKLIFNNKYAEEIKDLARKEGMKTLTEHCAEKVLKGITTLDELLKLTLVTENTESE